MVGGFPSHGGDLDAMADEAHTHQTNDPAPAGRFDAVTLPHLEVMLRVARSLSANTHDAEDLVQDTLLRAFRAIASFDGRHPRAWLLTIMRNANVNRHRRQRPSLLRGDTEPSYEADRRNPSSPSSEDIATSGLSPAWLVDALAQLTPQHRRIVQLVDVEGLTYDEAASILDIPVGTVMRRLHRARQHMRTRLTLHPDFRSEHR